MANPAAGYHYGNAPPPQSYGGYQQPSAPYGAPPYGMLAPSTFAPGTDPTVIACFQVADQDGSGMIDDIELQRALSSYNQSFQLRTVHLLMYSFTGINTRKIGMNPFSVSVGSHVFCDKKFIYYTNTVDVVANYRVRLEIFHSMFYLENRAEGIYRTLLLPSELESES
ncbi:UNVERIFIED_CONTAM: Calcium-binding protein CBP [Sesamum angustifolium]|uniref:Calcium-binding protein CBP n=1 Tax=Sesamum angustifolium TaxID=2727405 RepID=A0AAW2MTN4_9LAMI